MTKKTLAVGATVLAVIFAAAACSDSDTGTTAATSSATTSTASAVEETAAHNDADVMFAQMMIPHHAQAIEMSDMLLAKENIPAEVSELAEQIKAAQRPEIEQLESWLNEWGEPAQMPEMGNDMPGMDGMDEGMDGMGGMEMEGMMSEEDMQALDAAQGAEAGQLFLEQMIVHHEGAVEMAQTEVAEGENADAVAMAQEIVETQQAEISTMADLLTSR